MTRVSADELIEAQKPRVLLLDIECSNLNANFGYVLCIGYKWLGESKATVISITDFPEFKRNPTNDKHVVREAAKILRTADMWITWYGSRYDVPFIQSRLVFHKQPIMPPVQHCDAWRIAKYKMKLNSNRLASVSAFLEIEEKTPLSGPIWIRAAAGHRPSIKYVVEHCAQDVEVLEQAYLRIRPLATNHPSIALMGGLAFACPNCGSSSVKYEGYALSRLSKYPRYRCTVCGAWSREGKAIARTELR